MDVGMSLGENSRYLLNYYYGQLSAFFGMGYKFSEFVFHVVFIYLLNPKPSIQLAQLVEPWSWVLRVMCLILDGDSSW